MCGPERSTGEHKLIVSQRLLSLNSGLWTFTWPSYLSPSNDLLCNRLSLLYPDLVQGFRHAGVGVVFDDHILDDAIAVDEK